MRLAELEPQFLVCESPGHHRYVDALAGAHGVQFMCPGCFVANAGRIGTHEVIVWFRGRGVPDAEWPLTRWSVDAGSGYDDLTLSPSILITSGCMWHGFVKTGEVLNA